MQSFVINSKYKTINFSTCREMEFLSPAVTIRGLCCDTGQNDTIGRIELNPSFVLSRNNTNCKSEIQ